MKIFALAVLLVLAGAACERDTGPPLEISTATVFAPLPGTHTAVAYMTIKNNTPADIVVESISSPQFASVMMHETRIIDGVARMTMLKSLLIPAHSSVVLEEGGKHIMLMNPVQAVQLKQPVSLRVNYDMTGLVIVNTTFQSRFERESTS